MRNRSQQKKKNWLDVETIWIRMLISIIGNMYIYKISFIRYSNIICMYVDMYIHVFSYSILSEHSRRQKKNLPICPRCVGIPGDHIGIRSWFFQAGCGKHRQTTFTYTYIHIFIIQACIEIKYARENVKL